MSDTNQPEIDYKKHYEKAFKALMRLMVMHKAIERNAPMSAEYQHDTIALANDVIEHQPYSWEGGL